MEKCYCFLCSPFLNRKFTNVGETVFVVSRGIFRRSFPKVLRFLLFRTLSKVFGVSPNIFLQDCQNCFLSVQRTFTGQRIFRKVLRFLFFRTLSKVFGISQNIFLQDCQNCFLCVQRTFMGQRVFLIGNLYQFPSFSDFERNQIVFSWKNSDILVKIAFHMSQETFRGVFSGNFVLVRFFVFCSKTIWTFIGKILKGSLKLHSLCPEQLEENVFFWTFCF